MSGKWKFRFSSTESHYTTILKQSKHLGNSIVKMKKRCAVLKKELQDYLHEQEHELAVLLKRESPITANEIVNDL